MSKENETSTRPEEASTESEAWATLVLSLPAGPTTVDALAEAADRLESLGSLLAAEDGVGGVETRDPTVLEARERPALVVYTTPNLAESIQTRAAQLGALLGLDLAARLEIHHDDSWRDSWKQYYQPMHFGERLTIRPSWIERAADDSAPQLILDPGRAFGTGLHESTRLCLDSLTETSPRRCEQVLDLGCGSGILGLAVATMHVDARVRALDIDPEAADTTAENAAHNALQSRVESSAGTLDSIPAETGYDLVIANIRPSVLVPQAARIIDRVNAGGTLILSGILVEEGPEVREAYASLGAPDQRTMGEWVMLRWDRVGESG